MNNLDKQISNYLEYCQYQRRLDDKSLKAYRIDLRQFSQQYMKTIITDITSDILEKYITILNKTYKPKIKRQRLCCCCCLNKQPFLPGIPRPG